MHACMHCLAHSAAAPVLAKLTTKLACICKCTQMQCRLHKPGNMCPLLPLGGNLHCQSGELRVQWPIHHGAEVRLMPCCCPQVFPHPAHRAAGGVQRWCHDRSQQGPGQGVCPAGRVEPAQHLHLRCAGTCSFNCFSFARASLWGCVLQPSALSGPFNSQDATVYARCTTREGCACSWSQLPDSCATEHARTSAKLNRPELAPAAECVESGPAVQASCMACT